ncbi:MAG: hypothetical protein IKG69_11470 [Atopobiaceae bacterium]|nr:hypothetical protein [Atopobiaceae bacterium]
MSAHESRDLWRTRCEQLVDSGMKVHEWCALNHVRAASMYEWLKVFHREDPSMFGGIGLPEGMEGYGRGWYEAVRRAYAEAHSIVPQRLCASPSFAVVDAGDLAPRQHAVGGADITVTIGAAAVTCPVGCDAGTLATVLGAVSAL